MRWIRHSLSCPVVVVVYNAVFIGTDECCQFLAPNLLAMLFNLPKYISNLLTSGLE